MDLYRQTYETRADGAPSLAIVKGYFNRLLIAQIAHKPPIYTGLMNSPHLHHRPDVTRSDASARPRKRRETVPAPWRDCHHSAHLLNINLLRALGASGLSGVRCSPPSCMFSAHTSTIPWGHTRRPHWRVLAVGLSSSAVVDDTHVRIVGALLGKCVWVNPCRLDGWPLSHIHHAIRSRSTIMRHPVRRSREHQDGCQGVLAWVRAYVGHSLTNEAGCGRL